MIIFPIRNPLNVTVIRCYGTVSNGRSLAENFSSILSLLSLELKKNVVSLQSDN